MLERLNITVIRYVTLIIVIKTNMSWATIVITESMVTPTLPEHHLKENSNKAQGPLLLDNAITLTHSVLEVPSCYSRYSCIGRATAADFDLLRDVFSGPRTNSDNKKGENPAVLLSQH